MRWYFRDISDDPSEKELTQQDQFNNDEVALTEALVRETIQNSTDAQASSIEPVRVRFAVTSPATEQHRIFLNQIIDDVTPHLVACGIGRPPSNEPNRLLVVEDFGTSGLTGSVEEKDNGQFSGFWRRFGRSNKAGTKGGRWGLGKLVFPSVSAVRIVIGLTRRPNENRAWLMGQAVLKNHSIDGSEKDSVGFWCRSDVQRKGIPTDDSELCNSLTEAAAFTRRKEPGLSLAIPFIQQDITSENILIATVRNYYFAIITGRLIVIVDDIEVDARTFDAIAATLPSDAISQSTLDFVRQLQKRWEDDQDVFIPAAWQQTGISGELLGADLTNNLRDKFKSGAMLSARAPLLLKDKNGKDHQTHIDLFIKATKPGERAQTIVVRGAITVPTEGKRANLVDSYAALVATDESVSRLLGDAENPAHTQWNERAEKLRLGWDRGGMALRRIRAAIHELHELVSDKIERDDPLALLDFFSIAKPDRGDPAHKPSVGRPVNLPPAKPKAFRIHKRSGGFAIVPGPGIDAVEFPLTIRVRCAYDVLTGNPFKRFSDLDFNFFVGGLQISTKSANCWPNEPNEIDVRAEKPDFSVEVSGFDRNRDLIIEAQA
jgi:hypothetical protein